MNCGHSSVDVCRRRSLPSTTSRRRVASVRKDARLGLPAAFRMPQFDNVKPAQARAQGCVVADDVRRGNARSAGRSAKPSLTCRKTAGAPRPKRKRWGRRPPGPPHAVGTPPGPSRWEPASLLSLRESGGLPPCFAWGSPATAVDIVDRTACGPIPRASGRVATQHNPCTAGAMLRIVRLNAGCLAVSRAACACACAAPQLRRFSSKTKKVRRTFRSFRTFSPTKWDRTKCGFLKKK